MHKSSISTQHSRTLKGIGYLIVHHLEDVLDMVLCVGKVQPTEESA